MMYKLINSKGIKILSLECFFLPFVRLTLTSIIFHFLLAVLILILGVFTDKLYAVRPSYNPPKSKLLFVSYLSVTWLFAGYYDLLSGDGFQKISELISSSGSLSPLFILLCCGIVLFSVLGTYIVFSCIVDNISTYKTITNCLNRKPLSLILGIILISCIPLLIPGTTPGHDASFHLMRISGMATELKNNVFPVRMQHDWYNGYGIPVSVYYPDIFLYPFAFLSSLGIPAILSQKLYIATFNAITAILSYYCFSKIFRERQIALILTAMYVFSPYRYICIYTRDSLGAFTAQTFFPLIALSCYYILSHSHNRKWVRNAFLLAMGMTGIIESHILTFEIISISLLVLLIIKIKKAINGYSVLSLFSAVVLTILLNMSFLIPFLDYYQNIDAYYMDIIFYSWKVNLWDVIKLINPFYGFGTAFTQETMSTTPGLVQLFAVAVSLYLVKDKKFGNTGKLLLGLSLASVIMSTTLFPWMLIDKAPVISFITHTLQFPWRLLGVTSILTVLLIGIILKSDTAKKTTIVNLIALSILFITCSVICQDRYKADEILEGTTPYWGEEYMLRDSYGNLCDGEIIVYGDAEVSNLVRNKKLFTVDINNNDTETVIDLPVFNYRGYEVTDEAGNTYPVQSGYNMTLRFTVPSGFNGTMSVKYTEPDYWKMCECISIVSWIVCLAGFAVYHKKFTSAS